MVNRDKSILQHIKLHCNDIFDFIDRFGKDFTLFTSDRAYFNAVSMCILQIGELSKSLSDEFIAETSEKIPWQSIKGMRNLVAHEYGSLDEELVWETVIADIPVLFEFCIAEIERLSKSSD